MSGIDKVLKSERADLDNLQADNAALVEDEALAHDVVAPRVLAVLKCGLSVAIVDAEDARPRRPGVVGCS